MLLSMKGIDKSFSGVKVLTAATLDVEAGEVMALVGQNGAGKSTLIKILTGAYSRDAGEVVFEDKPVDFRSTAESQAAGIATIYQEINLAPHRSVAENIFLAREPRKFGLVDRRRMRDGGARGAEALQPRHRRRPAARGVRRRNAADGGDRPRRHPERQAGHHGRADLLARRARGRGAVRHDPHAEGRRRRDALHQPSARRALRDLRPRHDHARRPHGRREPDEGHLQDRARALHARQGADRLHGGCAQQGRQSASEPFVKAENLSSGVRVRDVSLWRSATARSPALPACSAPAAPRRRG